MQDIETMVELEDLIKNHQEALERLTAYSVRGMLHPDTFVLELVKMQKQTLSRCLKLVPEQEKERLLPQLERLMNK